MTEHSQTALLQPRAPVAAACRLIGEPRGEAFLRLMRCLYFDEPPSAAEASPDLLREMEAAGLIRELHRRVTLTEIGYLVGNVAKEYCNFVDQGRHLPHPRPPEALYRDKDVLDLGCSFGRWLWEFQRLAKTATGIEMQPDYVELGIALSAREGRPTPCIRVGSVEDVDRLVEPGSVDFAFSRLVLNHVAIRSTLAKTAATLGAGGALWLHLETIRWPVSLFLRERRLQTKAFAAVALVNTAWCTATGLQFSLRARGRMHSWHRSAFPPVGWWRSALKEAGLVEVELVDHSRDNAVFLARKRA